MISIPGLSDEQLRVVLRRLVDHTLVNNFRLCLAIAHLLMESSFFLVYG